MWHRSISLVSAVAIVVLAGAILLAHTAGRLDPFPAPASLSGPPAQPAVTASRTAKVPFKPGELLTYDVSWSNFLTAGEATLAVKEQRPTGSSSAYYIVAEGKTVGLVSNLYTVYYKADTLLDASSLLPIKGTIFSREGRRTRNKITTFDRKAERAAYEMRTATVMTKDLWIPRDAQDAVSAIFVLRTLTLTPGSKHTMTICDNSQLYRLVATVEGRETIKTGLGSRQALRIRPAIFNEKGEPQGRSLFLWLSDDAARIPLKMTAELPVGSFNLVLRQTAG
jgi:hypothetical protein